MGGMGFRVAWDIGDHAAVTEGDCSQINLNLTPGMGTGPSWGHQGFGTMRREDPPVTPRSGLWGQSSHPAAIPLLPGVPQHHFIPFNARPPLVFILFLGLTRRAAAGLAPAQKRRGRRLHNSSKRGIRGNPNWTRSVFTEPRRAPPSASGAINASQAERGPWIIN